MTATALQEHIGLTYHWRYRDLVVEVLCRDARCAYGKTQLKIVPVAGLGEMWVDLPSLTLAATAPRVANPFLAGRANE